MRRSFIVVAVAGGVIGIIVAAVAVGTALWNRSTARTVERLIHDDASPDTTVLSHEELEGLPDPVARYFEFTLTPGQPLVRRARIEQTGDFRIGGLDASWSPFTAVQHFTTNPPGFVWDADIRMAPMMSVRVRDRYLSGAGSMQGKVASLVTVVDEGGYDEFNESTLQRYLAEAVWFPTALLPSQGVTWESVDETTARATIDDGTTSASVKFHFSETGEIVRMETQRFRDVDGEAVLTPWVGHYWNYTSVAGMMVPLDGQIEWILPEGELPYWRATLDVEYEFYE